ncbi:hypothetical protein GUJ93_ZPchr0006g43628 [Zizania palustris]|uniref:non-specific serine/threonine protein kinase n=1 Tax=Zizania palustris TaxID=103762 RepID=A0A8J5SUR2_ZIZPA|nr:hypothetical protein GUJ93_ZPchr0006g43628 [Zizania palustris]
MDIRAAILLFLVFYIVQFVHGQPDSRGFISIDCGIPENSSYQDGTSTLIYVSDYGFISTGANHGTRNCYTLRSLVEGNKYFVRAVFYYANYDGLNKLPVFDLYLGANYWHEVYFRDAGKVNWMDIIVVAPSDYLQIQHGAHRQFDSQVPLDPHDRIWSTYDTIPEWTEVSATSVVRNYLTDVYDAPSAVMQNAAMDNSSRINFSWDPSDPSVNISSKYFFVFYFSELQSVPSNALRQFDIIVNNETWNTQPYTPPFLFASSLSGTVQGLTSYSVSLVATKNASLPPILNAMEMYLVKPIAEFATDPGDAKAMIEVQQNYNVNKNWMGDPCSPKSFAWEGLNCSYPPADSSKITSLNLSSSGLSGSIATYFGDLKSLQYLDLSHNNLSGRIPNFLGQLPSLMFLDLSSNDLSGPVPYNLLQKSQNGILSVRVGNNANLCGNGTECRSGRKKMNGPLLAAIIIPIVVTILLSVILIILLRQTLKPKAKRKATGPTYESPLLGNREFSYRELKHITNNFSQEIGKGGFGAVFLGYLENRNPVAVKVRSESSSQGGKEFLAEAQHLTRIHHKNLVSLFGYCKDKNHLALVYGYMPGGNLQDHLRATTSSKPLTWEQRLQIAIDAAQGLEYLHVACKPALIHRDVKSRNILLTTNLGAKIADFGLTKAFSESKTHMTTEPAGTLGYLDPEYYCNYQISEKSDVYSFGVVLLELITGRPPVVPISESASIHVGEWVHQSLDHGNIESIVDARMGGDYDINSVWKAADLALHCKQEISKERPTMTEVLAQLKEILELETHRDRKHLATGDDGSELQIITTVPSCKSYDDDVRGLKLLMQD